jgi:hypothetical protein
MWTVVADIYNVITARLFRLQYSADCICAAIRENRTLRCPLYCKFDAKYSAHHPVYPMWTVVPDIYNVITARLFRLQYSADRICAAIGDISTIQCALYCKLGAKYSALPTVYAIWTAFPDMYNAITAPHIQASIFNWTYRRCYWRYLDNDMRVLLQTWWQIQRTSSRLCYLDCGHGHIQCKYSFAYSGFNIQMNVSALLQGIYRLFNVRYRANMVPNTTQALQFTLPELWSLTYTMYIQFRIFWLQYSNERICAAIADVSKIRRALYRKLGAKYSAHAPDYAIWTVVPHIYNANTVPHIQTSTFNSTYLCRYWRYLVNSMSIILQT